MVMMSCSRSWLKGCWQTRARICDNFLVSMPSYWPTRVRAIWSNNYQLRGCSSSWCCNYRNVHVHKTLLRVNNTTNCFPCWSRTPPKLILWTTLIWLSPWSWHWERMNLVRRLPRWAPINWLLDCWRCYKRLCSWDRMWGRWWHKLKDSYKWYSMNVCSPSRAVEAWNANQKNLGRQPSNYSKLYASITPTTPYT